MAALNEDEKRMKISQQEKKRLNALVKKQDFFRLLYLYFYIQYNTLILCYAVCAAIQGSQVDASSSSSAFYLSFSLLLSSAERRIKYIRRRRIFRLCWHWGLRASNSRSPPTRHTSSESTWEERKKEKKKKTVENRVHPIINFHMLLHFPSSFAFIYIFIYLKKRNPFFFGHRFTPPGNQLKTCWYG